MTTNNNKTKGDDYFDLTSLDNLPFDFGDYDGKEIIYFISWFLTKKMSCEDCITLKSMISGKAPNCFKCGLPTARLLKRHFKKERPYEKI